MEQILKLFGEPSTGALALGLPFYKESWMVSLLLQSGLVLIKGKMGRRGVCHERDAGPVSEMTIIRTMLSSKERVEARGAAVAADRRSHKGKEKRPMTSENHK